jgi:topoisomerase-4 subunit A
LDRLAQKYKEGTLSDLKLFTRAEGLSWSLGSKIRTEMELSPWLGTRAAVGKLPPVGFPRTNRFE